VQFACKQLKKAFFKNWYILSDVDCSGFQTIFSNNINKPIFPILKVAARNQFGYGFAKDALKK
jgi:hypothetical protein